LLLTGGSGFVGRPLIGRLVEAGFEVHVLGRSRVIEDHVQWHACDLLQCSNVKEVMQDICPSHLCHLAWVTDPGRYWMDLANVDWVAASLHLFRAFVDLGGTNVLVAGSCAEYDWKNCGDRISEKNTALVPATLYGIAKNSLHQMLRAASKEHNVVLTWPRFFFMYGPHEKSGRLVSDVIDKLTSGRPIAMSSGEQVRDFLHVADVCEAIVALLSAEYDGDVNVGSGQGVTIKDLALEIGQLTKSAHLLELGKLPQRPSDPPALVADTSLLKLLVKFEPKYALREGLAQVIDWRTRAESISAVRT
jgi:nucleoside-diphosphate-sugar epimerase